MFLKIQIQLAFERIPISKQSENKAKKGCTLMQNKLLN